MMQPGFRWALAVTMLGACVARAGAPSRAIRVELPSTVRPFPEGSDDGRDHGGFRIRGIKGWNWTPEQYMGVIPVLAKYRMSFLMNCYLSMYSDPAHFKNEWWLPIPGEKKQAYEQVMGACRKAGITFCFAMHPQLHSPRPLDPSSDADFEKFYTHFAWAQGAGAKWFCVSLDDIGGVRIDGAEHARFVNRMLARLRLKDPQAQMIFCPTRYWGQATAKEGGDYLAALGRELNSNVYVFWTGPQVISASMTRAQAQHFRDVVKHRLIIWDNYPVNDGHATIHLGPVSGRDPALAEVADGYMSNPMWHQDRINRLPMLTCADYAFNPLAYDPQRSVGQAIVHLAKNPAQQEAMKELVQVYPGEINGGPARTAWNPVRAGLQSRLDNRNNAQAWIEQIQGVQERFKAAFGDEYSDAQAMLTEDLNWMQARYAEKYGRPAVP